jgi:hypothetical protein
LQVALGNRFPPGSQCQASGTVHSCAEPPLGSIDQPVKGPAGHAQTSLAPPGQLHPTSSVHEKRLQESHRSMKS